MTNDKSGLTRPTLIDTTFEPHFTISELAQCWKYSRETIRQVIKDDPEVLKVRGGLRKAMTRYSIPESVARRIHTRLLNSSHERYNRR